MKEICESKICTIRRRRYVFPLLTFSLHCGSHACDSRLARNPTPHSNKMARKWDGNEPALASIRGDRYYESVSSVCDGSALTWSVGSCAELPVAKGGSTSVVYVAALWENASGACMAEVQHFIQLEVLPTVMRDKALAVLRENYASHRKTFRGKTLLLETDTVEDILVEKLGSVTAVCDASDHRQLLMKAAYVCFAAYCSGAKSVASIEQRVSKHRRSVLFAQRAGCVGFYPSHFSHASKTQRGRCAHFFNISFLPNDLLGFDALIQPSVILIALIEAVTRSDCDQNLLRRVRFRIFCTNCKELASNCSFPLDQGQ